MSALLPLPSRPPRRRPFDQLPDPHRTYIYRIVQEALTNCAKHAPARRISVTLVDRGDWTDLTVLCAVRKKILRV